jgi:RNA polymerase sigma-70 factor (ECF subfamily)
MQSPATPSDLVQAMARGDSAALSELYEQTVSQVFAIARGMLRSKEDAEEVVCDVYLSAWQRASSYDPKRGSVMAWLAVVTRNRAIDVLRQRRPVISLDDMDNEALAASLAGQALCPEQLLQQFQSGTAVHRALATLSEQRRQLLGLAFFQDLSHQEIAAHVGLPLGTVKSHVRRALAALQAELAAPERLSAREVKEPARQAVADEHAAGKDSAAKGPVGKGAGGESSFEKSAAKA